MGPVDLEINRPHYFWQDVMQHNSLRETPMDKNVSDDRSQTGEPDFSFSNHGSIWICTAHNDAAWKHLHANLGDEAQRWGRGVAVEPRYVEGLAEALRNNGWEVG
jgi:hypothetical protein